MMTQGELIDRIYGEMYRLAVSSKGTKYGFVRFTGSWGRKGTEEYIKKSQEFFPALMDFAKDCCIRSYNGNYYVFNGKIYAQVNADAVSLAYDKLMMSLGIMEAMLSESVKKKFFLNVIKNYNELNVRNDIIAFSNGVLDLSKKPDERCMFPFNPKYHILDYHPYPYQPDAKAPMFMKFLDEVLPDKRQRDILQMFLGLGLIQPSEIRDKKNSTPKRPVEMCLILLGSGANGKSVLFNIVCALFGRSHITSIDYSTITSEKDEGFWGRAAIRSAVFNWSSDSDPKRFGKGNNAIFKQICSGEPFQYRLLRHDIEESKNCPYLIFSFNELPNLIEGTNGFLRRLQFVNFDVTIPRYKQDPNLSQKIIESDLPGVFNWVLRGSKEIRRRKFMFPVTVTSRRNKIKALLATNPVSSWMLSYNLRSEETNALEGAVLIKSDVLYDSFVNFCKNNDAEDLLSSQAFGRFLGKLNFRKSRKRDGIYYFCYGVTEEVMNKPVVIDMVEEPEENGYSSDDRFSYIKYD